MKLTITGYSTALFATWYFIEELGLLFDAGEGLTSGLLQKSRKVKNAFISHADRDHLTGLFQFNQLNAREGFPIIHFPKDCGSFPALENFTKQFDPHVKGTVWKPITEKSEIKIRKDVVIQPIRNGHVIADEEVSKSLSYKVFQTKRKLKPELLKLSNNEIKNIVAQQGEERTTTEVRTNLLSYSGDTPVEDLSRWDHSKILIHEATFLGHSQDQKIQTHGNKHSKLEEVIEMVANITVETLILGHFSSRYSSEQIVEHIRELCDKYALQIPVYCVLPGEINRNILQGAPVNA